MGRFSSTGHLVQRVDAGQLTSHRDLPVHLAPLVSGNVLLPWLGRTRALAGKSTVEISLGSGDATPRFWTGVGGRPTALAEAGRLAPEQIEALAHGVRTSLRPRSLARVIAKAMARRSRWPSGSSRPFSLRRCSTSLGS